MRSYLKTLKKSCRSDVYHDLTLVSAQFQRKKVPKANEPRMLPRPIFKKNSEYSRTVPRPQSRIVKQPPEKNRWGQPRVDLFILQMLGLIEREEISLASCLIDPTLFCASFPYWETGAIVLRFTDLAEANT